MYISKNDSKCTVYTDSSCTYICTLPSSSSYSLSLQPDADDAREKWYSLNQVGYGGGGGGVSLIPLSPLSHPSLNPFSPLVKRRSEAGGVDSVTNRQVGVRVVGAPWGMKRGRGGEWGGSFVNRGAIDCG